MRVEEFQQLDEDLDDDILGDEYMTLQETFTSVATALPALHLPSEPSKPFANAFETLDFKALVRQRKQHQTRQAARSARVKNTKPDEEEASTVPVESTRHQLLRKYHELLKEDQSRGVGTAVECLACWTTDPKPAAGNAVDAAAAAVATKAATRRTKLLRETKLPAPLLAVVKDASLTSFKPLLIGSFGVIWTEITILINEKPPTKISQI
ncbi:hypothetical protein B0H14DRAFT_3156436 [Mycena olivaceomarginata]|nr:hypothetical protein B0H14DRAFT_3156436 [Mycena olivaceomarginata]